MSKLAHAMITPALQEPLVASLILSHIESLKESELVQHSILCLKGQNTVAWVR